MALLEWDKVGERTFEAGIRKGVLYLPDGSGVVWNGLTSVEDSTSADVEPITFDGVKFNDIVTVGDFKAVLKAFTYPDEFLEFEGTLRDEGGLYVTSQPYSRFGLSYQTTYGDDVHGSESGYKIHILWNLTAAPNQRTYSTLSLNVDPIEFEWDISAIPEIIENFRPTAHAIIDSRKIDPYLLADIEGILYGEGFTDLEITDHGDGSWTADSDVPGAIEMLDDTTFEITSDTAEYLDTETYTISSSDTNAHLPSLKALAAFIRNWERLIITDNGDGSWSAHSNAPDEIVMLSDTKFQITSDTAVYLDTETYKISSSDKEDGDIWLP